MSEITYPESSSSGEGLNPGLITSPEDTRAITAFITWTA
jgi:hypothetical protein